MSEQHRHKSDYCFTNKDLFANMKWDVLNLPKWLHRKKGKDTRTEYITDVFMYCFNLILLDIVENNATFVLPLFGNKEGCFHVRRVIGDEFKNMRQAGSFQGIDFLKSNFSGCVINFQYTTTYGLRNKTLHVSSKLRDKLYDNINNGKQYY